LGKKSEFGPPRWPIALFADDYLGSTLVRAIRVVNFIAVDKSYHISILFYGTRFSQISQLGALVVPFLYPTVQLRKSHYWHVKLLSQGLE
jgi:hypothetical protein